MKLKENYYVKISSNKKEKKIRTMEKILSISN